MKDYIKTAILAVGAGVAVKSYLFLSQPIGNISALVLSVVLSVSVIKICELLLIELPLHFHIFRKFLDPASKFEGYWSVAPKNLPERPRAIGIISYNSNTKAYRYHGYAVGKKGIIEARWSSQDVIVNLSEYKLKYIVEGKILTDQPVSILGFGVMSFDHSISGKISTGTDFFVDTKPEQKSSQTECLMRRIPNKEVRKILNGKNPSDHEDYETILATVGHD